MIFVSPPPSHAIRLKTIRNWNWSWSWNGNGNGKETSANIPLSAIPAENPQTAHTSAAAAQRTSSSRARKRLRLQSGTTLDGRVRSSMMGSRRRGWRIGGRSFSRALWGGRSRSGTTFQSGGNEKWGGEKGWYPAGVQWFDDLLISRFEFGFAVL